MIRDFKIRKNTPFRKDLQLLRGYIANVSEQRGWGFTTFDNS